MGQHSSAESLLAGVEADSLRVKAAALAVQLHDWLTISDCGTGTPDLYRLLVNGREDGNTLYPSDVIELLRSVRDVLEAVGRG